MGRASVYHNNRTDKWEKEEAMKDHEKKINGQFNEMVQLKSHFLVLPMEDSEISGTRTYFTG